MLEAQKSTYFVEINELKLKGLNKIEVNEGAVPIRDCLVKVVKGRILLVGKWKTAEKAETVIDVEIEKEFPRLTLDRKN